MIDVKDRLVQHPRRFKVAKVPGTQDQYEFTPEPGTVQEPGTPVNKALFDSIKKDINGKVDKVEGKGLSTNDYDDTEKQKVRQNTAARHSHTNKQLLDTYDQTNEDIKDAVSKKHSHSNKDVLDQITEAFTTELKKDISDNTTRIEEVKDNAWEYRFNQSLDLSKIKSLVSPTGIEQIVTYNKIIFRGTCTTANPLGSSIYAIKLNGVHKHYVTYNYQGTASLGFLVQKRNEDGNVTYDNIKTEIISNINRINLFDNTSGIGKKVDCFIQPMVIDLTEMFGAGNEPKSVDELYKYIEKDTYYPYQQASSLQLGETADTAYAGDKGKKNREDINALKTSKIDKGNVKKVTKINVLQELGQSTKDLMSQKAITKYVKGVVLTNDNIDLFSLKIGKYLCTNASYIKNYTNVPEGLHRAFLMTVEDAGDGDVFRKLIEWATGNVWSNDSSREMNGEWEKLVRNKDITALASKVETNASNINNRLSGNDYRVAQDIQIMQNKLHQTLLIIGAAGTIEIFDNTANISLLKINPAQICFIDGQKSIIQLYYIEGYSSVTWKSKTLRPAYNSNVVAKISGGLKTIILGQGGA